MSRNKNAKRMLTGVILSCGLGAVLAGCATNAQTNSLIGAGLGAAIGNWIGDDTKGTLIGAGVGAAAGYAIGNEADKSDAQNRDRQRDRTYDDDD